MQIFRKILHLIHVNHYRVKIYCQTKTKVMTHLPTVGQDGRAV